MMHRAMDKGPCVCGGRECAGKAANSHASAVPLIRARNIRSQRHPTPVILSQSEKVTKFECQ